jgi:putative ABC transport system permease protein
MFRNYVTIALRNIQRQKIFSSIKILGLSIGIASCLLIYLFVVDELSFDKFHANGKNLYRVVQVQHDLNTGKLSNLQQFIPTPVGPELERSFSDIKHQSRFVNGTGVVLYEEKIFQENLTLVDSAFLEMFTFPLVYGNETSALSNDQSLVLTQSHAQKYFGKQNPMGKSLTLSFGLISKDFIVTGVTEDVPLNSSIRFDILIQFNNLPLVINNANILNEWNRWYCPLLVELLPGTSAELVNGRLDGFCDQYYSAKIQENIDSGYDPFTLGLQEVRKMHLDARVFGTAGLSPSYLLSVIALVILLIACVNYMNLSIGSASVRSMEVGMRKVLGANRRQLVRQFISEALLISLVAVFFGILLADLLLPKFNELAGKQLSIGAIFDIPLFLSFMAIAFITGLCAGIYPALIMSGFLPVEVLKGKLKIGGKTSLTKGLIVFQFALSIVLVVSAIILGKQVFFMVNKNPGYTSDGLVVILTQENEQEESERIYKIFRNEISLYSQIKGVTASNREFGLFLPGTTLELDKRKIHYRFNRVDPNFLSTIKLNLVEGKDFSANIASESDAVIVNQKFIDELGPEYRLGETIGDISKGFPSSSRIIGVIENPHIQSLRSEMEPLLLYVGKGLAPGRDRFSFMFVRVGSEDVFNTMTALEKTWKKVQPDKPFVYYFQEDALENLYVREKRWSAIVRYASALSILLACLGVFGLTAMTLIRREKEFGIRKVLGARLEQIVYLGMKDYIYLVGIANLVAWPVVYLIMRRVLQDYPFRINIGFQYFLMAGASSIIIAVLTILSLSLKSALANPAESLKYE